MKHSSTGAALLLLLATTLIAGCNNDPATPQAVVIDIAAISEAAGINAEIKQRSETINQQLSEEMKTLSHRLSKELEVEKTALPENPSEEDEKRIQALRTKLRKQITQARMAGNARLAKERTRIRQSFLADITPLAREVAQERGAQIILKTPGGVFWSDEMIDITDDVVERMLSREDSESPASKSTD